MSSEYEFLLNLEHIDEVVAFQEQPYEIPYTFESRNRTYYPDILFVLKDGRGVVVEIKPRNHMAIHLNLVKRDALKRFCEVRGLGFLITDGKRSIKKVQNYPIMPDFEQAVLNILRTRSIKLQEWKAIKSKYNPKWDEFFALIILNGLVWNPFPFELRKQA